MSGQLLVVHLEDSAAEAKLIHAELASGGLDCHVMRVDTRQDFEAAIGDCRLQLILADYNLPSFDGLTALRLARDLCSEVPFIFVSGAIGEERAVEMLKAGATDYVLKQNLGRLVPSVKRALREAHERTQRRLAQEEVTRLLASEREARDAAEAANRAKDRFLAVLSHELRTPLTPVVMTLAAMELDPTVPYEWREDVAMIRRNIDLEAKLIDDLLDLSRVTSGKMRLNMQPTRIHPLLRHVVSNCASEASGKKLHIHLEMNAENDQVSADPARLQQVFWNLLKNGVKFTPEGGDIFVRTANVDGKIRVEFRDTGKGIPPHVLPRVFDAFEQGDVQTTQHFGGLGLGLAICRAVMEMHGASIRASSEGLDRGATFTVEVTIAAQAPKRDNCQEGSGQAAAAPAARLLLVEDHPDTSRVLARLLERVGYCVRTAHSIASALELAASEPFDILLSDLGLPDGSGHDLMRQIRERHNLKGIALSGYGMEEDIRRSREAGFSDHVVKPVEMSQLNFVIKSVLADGA